jgi:hypothetical protein
MPEREEERELAGSGGDDMSAGTSVSGLGGEALRTADEEAGLPPVHEGGARSGWGRAAAESGEQLVAGNDGTGQSERPDETEPSED